LNIREVNKQIDSYGTNVVELIHPVTGKIHTEYQTVGTQTGRFSSKNPNMQNVPTHGGYRECFLPEEDFVFIGVDYSQQEYRLAGAVSHDRRIIEAYKNGSDMHTATAQVLYGRDEITKDERSRGKTVNFAILYGSTEFGLKNNLNISVDEAKIIIKNFWEGYPQLDKFMQLAGKRILELGFSSTPMGRRRYNLPKPTFMNSYELDRWQSRVLREGKNHIIQGGGADILKLAMVQIDKRNPFGRYLKICLQIHDELVVQAHKSVMKEAGLFVRDIMEEIEQKFLGDIPAKADGWDEFKEHWSK
jgi:DNA polymerase-1